MEIKLFENNELGTIRTTTINGEVYFIAKDLANALGYKETNDMTRWLDDEDKFTTKEFDPEQLGVSNKIRMMTFINESGLYEAIFHSNKPNAKKFKKWVTGEVLPSIRKHGAYMNDEIIDNIMNNPQFAIDLVSMLQKEKEKRVKAEQEKAILVHTNKVYTATEIAKELGFKSAIQLNKDLCDRRIQFKQNETWVLFSKYANLGYTEIKQTVLDNGKIVYDRRWTGLGREFLLKVYGVGE